MQKVIIAVVGAIAGFLAYLGVPLDDPDGIAKAIADGAAALVALGAAIWLAFGRAKVIALAGLAWVRALGKKPPAE